MRKFERIAVAVVVAGAIGVNISNASTSLPVPGATFGSATPWWMFVCPGGIITAAMVKNWAQHKELTAPEAWTCGFLYWWNQVTGQPRRP